MSVRGGRVCMIIMTLCLMLFGSLTVCAADKGTTVLPRPGEPAVIFHSQVYGDVLIANPGNGRMDYTFLNEDWPSVRKLLSALNSGAYIDILALLTESADGTSKIKDYRGDPIRPYDMPNYGAPAAETRGDYQTGSIYGPSLSDKELSALRIAVSDFLIDRNPADQSVQKRIRMAHDYLMERCVPAPKGNYHHADDAYGALVNKAANAKGYARAMQALCDAMGVASYLVSSNGSSAVKDHMWNVVGIGEGWYIVDSFVDDSVGNHSMFLISDASYERLGMRWNKSESLPKAKKNYK